MAKKIIYFNFEGNENSAGTIVDIISNLEAREAKCLMLSSSEKVIKRLCNRKTKIDFLALMMGDMGNGFISKFRKEVPPKSYPRCIMFINSLVSPISDEEFERNKAKLELSGIESFKIGLIELSNLTLISKILEI